MLSNTYLFNTKLTCVGCPMWLKIFTFLWLIFLALRAWADCSRSLSEIFSSLTHHLLLLLHLDRTVRIEIVSYCGLDLGMTFDNISMLVLAGEVLPFWIPSWELCKWLRKCPSLLLSSASFLFCRASGVNCSTDFGGYFWYTWWCWWSYSVVVLEEITHKIKDKKSWMSWELELQWKSLTKESE